jgi:hypothetical protein
LSQMNIFNRAAILLVRKTPERATGCNFPVNEQL